MLNHSTVRLPEKLAIVSDLFLGAPLPVEQTRILGFDGMRNKFLFKNPANIRVIKDIKQFLVIELKMAEDSTFSTIVAATSSVYGQTLGYSTTIPIESLKSMAVNNIKLAYVNMFKLDQQEFKIEYFPIVSVREPEPQDFMNNHSEPPQEVVKKKRGRKPKVVEVKPKTKEEYLNDFSIVHVTSNDGTMYVCDGLIID